MQKKMQKVNPLVKKQVKNTNNSDDVLSRIHLNRRRRKRKNVKSSSVISLPVSSVSAFSGFTAVTTSSVKPKRSVTNLLLNGSIMFGREYCYAIEASLTTPILLGIGLPLQLYSLIWVISPVLGFILQPVLGNMSDRCRSQWGRRRPFILSVSILLVIGMTLFLNGQQLIEEVMGDDLYVVANKRFITVSTIVIVVLGVAVFDFSADFVEGPIRAYVMDVCDKDDVKRGLYYQAIFTGLGGAFGYASGGVSWVRDVGFAPYFATDQQVVYVFATVIFCCSLAMNLTSIPEKSQKPDTDKNMHRQTVPEIHEEKAQPSRKNKRLTKVRPTYISVKKEDEEEGTSKIVHSRKVKKKFKNRPQKYKTNLTENIKHQSSSSNQFPFQGIDEAKTSNGYGDNSLSKPPSNSIENKAIEEYDIPNSKNYTSQWVSKSRRWNYFGVDHYKSRRFLPYVEGPQTSYGAIVPSDSESTVTSKDTGIFQFPPPLQLNLPRKPDEFVNQINDETASFSVNDDRISHQRQPESRALDTQNAQDNAQETTEKCDHGLKQFAVSILQTPAEIKLLCIAHLLGWMGFLCIVLFFTDFVGQSVYGGDPVAPSGTFEGDAYKRGVEIGSWGMAINAAASSGYCFLLKPMIRLFGARAVYVFGYLAFSIGAIGMALFQNTTSILILSSLIGVMSGTLYTLPYFLVSKYHEAYKKFRGTSFERGVGADCALVTCMIQLAQIVIGLGVGGIVTWLNTVTVTVVVGSLISFAGAIYVMLFIK